MQISDLSRFRNLADPTLSPDGSRAVFTVSRIDLDENEYRSELWMAPTDGGEAPRRLTSGPRDMQPKFSPDGRWLSFVRVAKEAKPQVYVLPVEGGDARRVTDEHMGAGNAAWSPDSRRLVYVSRVAEPGRYGTEKEIPPEKEAPRRITSRKFHIDGVGYTRDRRPHLFVVDVEVDSKPVQITDGDWDDVAPAWSPDGSLIAFASERHETRESDLITDIYVVSPEGGDVRRVSDSSVPAMHPVFASDETLVFFADSHPDVVGRDVQLFSVPVTGGAPTPLTDAEDWHLDSYGSGSEQPLLLDGDAVITLNQRRGALELVRVPLDGSGPKVLVGGPRQVLAADRAGGVTVLLIADDTNTGELVVLADDGERALTDFGAALTNELFPMHEIDTTAPDGYPVHGWVVKPKGDGPFPVLLAVHGGPFAAYGWVPYDEAQVYAGAGYAVVLGNPRGASGYGEAHGRAIVGDLGNLDRADLLALLEAAVEDPQLDGDRLGVMGGSYGGFMTTLLAGTDQRFTAGISERAVNVWDSFTGSSDIGWFFVENYCGSDLQRQHEQSPLTYADNITMPMLIIHSEEDWRCPVEQAHRLFERLQRKGVESEMLLFPGEGHELSRSGLPSHRVARFEAILEWWGRHLPTGQSEADGSGETASASSSRAGVT